MRITNQNIINQAQRYLSQGWTAFPVPFKSKSPKIKAWTDLSATEAEKLWNFSGPSNIGVLLGTEVSANNYIIDLDIDDDVASDLAPYFFPDACSFGRHGKVRHCIFYADQILSRETYELEGGQIEIRGNGHQTIFPPSIHPDTGEEISWIGKHNPKAVPLYQLINEVRIFSLAVLLTKNWPQISGTRNDYALAASGLLAKSNVITEQQADLIYHMARIAGDEEARVRPSIKRARERLLAKKPIAGLIELKKHVDHQTLDRIKHYLKPDLREKNNPTNQQIPAIEDPENQLIDLSKYLLSAGDLVSMDIPPREFIIKPWLPHNSLSMVYAARGVGKTWIATSIAIAVATGQNFLHFEVREPNKVLFVDGEMTISDLQYRVRSLAASPPGQLSYLPSESLFQAGTPLNIFDPNHQQSLDAVFDRFFQGGRGLVILDNLSSLSGGVNENDNSEQEILLRWLIAQRHKSRSVLLVHHSGKSGDQRGASRREDMLDTVMKLEEPTDPMLKDPTRPKFELSFTKSRQQKPQPQIIDLTLIEGADGQMSWAHNNSPAVPDQIRLLRGIHELRPESQAQLIALTQMGQVKNLTKSKSSINRFWASLRDAGCITIDNGKPLITPFGYSKLHDHFPSEFDNPLPNAF